MRAISPLLAVAAMAALASCGPSGESSPALPTTWKMTEKDNPLIARSHLPLPDRLAGLRFVSEETGERGWAPGLLADGYYVLTFGPGSVSWAHADELDRFAISMTDQGKIVPQEDDMQIVARFDEARGQILWEGTWYRLLRSQEAPSIAAGGILTPPDWRPDETGPSALSEIPDGIKIDLTSPRRQYRRVGLAMGSIGVWMLGHDGEFCVFDYILEVEGGYTRYRHRLPISYGSATIQGDHQVRVTTSFDRSKSRKVHSGNEFFSKAGPVAYAWRQRHVREWPRYAVLTQDVRSGDGADPTPDARVKLVCWFYTDKDYLHLRPGAVRGAEVTFVMARGRGVAALDAAVEDMKAGGWRRARLRQEVAQGLTEAVPDMMPEELLHMEFQLVSVD